MNHFEKGYEKFKKFVQQTNLIPQDRSKIIISYSGGKDASIICDFLVRYKEDKRPDLDIEMITAGFPNFLYDGTNPENDKIMQHTIAYWEDKGITFQKIDVHNQHPDTLLEVPNPCKICGATKTTILAQYLRQKKNRHSIFCIGFNLDDSIGWFIEIFLLTCNLGSWNDIKQNNPKLYFELLMLSTRIVHSLYSETDDILFTRPIINFTNEEIKDIVKERNLPLIPENCKEITNRNEFYDSPRRDIGNALYFMRQKYDYNASPFRNEFYNNYFSSYEYYRKSNIIPPQQELDYFMAHNLMI